MKFWIFQVSVLCLRPHMFWEQKAQYVHDCHFKAKSHTWEGSGVGRGRGLGGGFGLDDL